MDVVMIEIKKDRTVISLIPCKEGYKMSAINHKTGACSMRVVSKEKVFNKLLELVDFDFIKSIIW